jgi:hypothetical protein
LPPGGAPGEDLLHDRGAGRVEDEAGLGAALGGLHRDRVGDPLGGVPIRRGADVPAVQGVLAQPLPCLLLDLEPIPFRDALLDPADQDAAGVHARQVDRLVRCEQRDPGVGQLPFQLERVERVPPGPLDVLTDHRSKPRVRPGGLGEQVRNAAIAGDPHVKPLVRAAPAACL